MGKARYRKSQRHYALSLRAVGLVVIHDWDAQKGDVFDRK
jgi:hypothetical protein